MIGSARQGNSDLLTVMSEANRRNVPEDYEDRIFISFLE